MRIIVLTFFIPVCMIFISCSDECVDCPPQNQYNGKLVVKSTPPGARIYLNGEDTGKTTPDSLLNLKPGTYDGFLYLQYYDTANFTAIVYDNLTTTKEIDLVDGLPFVDILLNYQTSSNGDSVKFLFQLNQDVLMDSIIVKRPINMSGDFLIDKFYYNKTLLFFEDLAGNPIIYFLPPAGVGNNFFYRVRNFTYWFDFYGQKAYGAKVNFHIFIGKNV